MTDRSLPRGFAPLALLLAAGFTPAAEKPAEKTSTPSTSTGTWDTSRVTSPESVDELKSLQSKVKGVYTKALPTTVGLLLGGDGGPGGSAGSGVIVSADGLVLTAAHVISRQVKVGKTDRTVTEPIVLEPVVIVLPDGRTVKGITLGQNATADSGMVRITDAPPKDYPGAKDGKWPYSEVGLGDSLKAGQWIVSLGHPGGPKRDRPPPVRTGRFLSFDKAGRFQKNDLLCTDATLVGGDSGGPLFDLDGKVVGIHSEIGESLDTNRHIPSEKFKAEWDAMVRGDIWFASAAARDRATKIALNVVFEKENKLPKIEEVSPNGAAEKAGIEAGDVIVKFNGNAVKSADDLRAMMPSYKVGEKVKVDVDRGGSTITLEVKLSDKSKIEKKDPK